MSKPQIEYYETDLFQKEFNKLAKKYRSLPDDFLVAKKNAIELFHIQHLDNHSVFAIEGECTPNIMFYKLKKFACKSLKGRGNKSGIRIIYAYHVDIRRVVFIQIYFKADQENEDRQRIREYLSEQI